MGKARSTVEQARFMLGSRMALGQTKHRFEQSADGRTVRVPLQAGMIHSFGTRRAYVSCLRRLADHTMAIKGSSGQLHRLKPEDLRGWLEHRSSVVGQKQLNNDRRAIEVAYGLKLEPIKSEIETHLKSRAYSNEQIRMVAECQTERHRLATAIAAAAGLRAHELLTLRPIAEQPPSERRGWRADRFGRLADEARYTVKGKGGLVREVRIPRDLAERLEATRLAEPRLVRDLDVDGKSKIAYQVHYGIGGGNAWASSFSGASKRALNWSNGAHGLRHSYAQRRMSEEQGRGKSWSEALSIVSQELGHFRETITLTYLR